MQFKKGQIVYVKARNGDVYNWKLAHYVKFVEWDVYPHRASLSYEDALQGVADGIFKECLSVEDYQKMINKPKDKDFCWCFLNTKSTHFDAIACFYDAKNNGVFSTTGCRGGVVFEKYEVIPREQWPQWAVGAYELLED
jgi:hypothetical protein